jgi:hypothetical protein
MASALGNEQNEIAFEEGMMPSYHEEAREVAREVIAFRRENIALIERMSANSE